jgi:hypothetical protein
MKLGLQVWLTQGRIKSLRGPRALKNVVGVC